jgi:hypothetical protein
MRAIETSSPERNFLLRRFRLTTAALVGGIFLTVSSPALARPDFPGIIVDELNRTEGPDKPGITCTPTCSLCHTSPSPDSGNAATKMANTLLLFRGQVRPPFDDPNDKYPDDIEVETLPVFLDALENDPCPNMSDAACVDPMMCLACNSDGEGAADIAELRRDQDPNGPGALACPKYGCGARIAPERSNRPLDGTAALAALSAAIVFVRRWRRRSA